MPKKNKQLKFNRFNLIDYEKRPVTPKDKWCQRKKLFRGQAPTGDAPWGYIVTIPCCPNQNMFLDNVDGYIVRCKKHSGKLLVQVIKKEYTLEYPEYGVKSFARQEKNNVKKKRKNKKFSRIINIRNFNKSEGKW